MRVGGGGDGGDEDGVDWCIVDNGADGCGAVGQSIVNECAVGFGRRGRLTGSRCCWVDPVGMKVVDSFNFEAASVKLGFRAIDLSAISLVVVGYSTIEVGAICFRFSAVDFTRVDPSAVDGGAIGNHHLSITLLHIPHPLHHFHLRWQNRYNPFRSFFINLRLHINIMGFHSMTTSRIAFISSSSYGMSLSYHATPHVCMEAQARNQTPQIARAWSLSSGDKAVG